MKAKMVKILKAVAVSMMTLMMVAVGTLNVPADASAAEVVKTETSGVIYVEYSNIDYTQYWGKKAPEYIGVDSNGVGYLFGGWYDKTDANEYTPIETEEDCKTAAANKTLVAKFVPAQTMSVKCQNWAGTNALSDDVLIRVISATDSLNYSQFGFKVSKIVNGKETVFNDYTTDTVYKKFNYYSSQEDTEPDTYTPSQLFGKAAQRFTTCTVGKIPTAMHGAIICLKPFWVTLDGTTVYGLAKYAHVEDGYAHVIDGTSYMYVNVPVNLNILGKDSGAAAGYLSVQSDDDLGFLGAEKGVECGRVFDEINFNVTTDAEGKTLIKCVGNTSDISDKTEMDIYINLKFLRKVDAQASDKPIADNFYTFTVSGEHFSSSAEKALDNLNVWNIIY